MKMNHILCWNYVFLLGVVSSICLVECSHNNKKSILPQLVDNIVENEIVRKVPAVKSVVKKASKRNKLAALGSSTHLARPITKRLHHTPPIISALLPFVHSDQQQNGDGSHMKAATDAINKLVDESIAQKLHVRTIKNLGPSILNRVEEAEREVSQMLLKNIEHHIQDAGKIFISPDDKEAACRDKLDGCDKLAKAGVCKTSRDAMKINCRHTCNYCQPVVFNTELQSKLLSELVVLKNMKAKLAKHFAARGEVTNTQIKGETGASATNEDKLDTPAQEKIVKDLVELEEHIRLRTATKVPSAKRSSVEGHHDVQGLMNTVEKDLKGDDIEEKREKVISDVWSLTKTLDHLENEPTAQSNLVKRSQVYPKVATTIANKLGEILSQGLLLSSDTQSKVWDELEGVVADISRGVKDVALKKSLESVKQSVPKNSSNKKDLVQPRSDRNSQLKLMNQLRSLMSVHSRLVSKLFSPDGNRGSKVKKNSQDAIKEIVAKALRENFVRQNIVKTSPTVTTETIKENAHAKKKFVSGGDKQPYRENNSKKQLHRENDSKKQVMKKTSLLPSSPKTTKSKVHREETAHTKSEIHIKDREEAAHSKSEIHIKDDEEKIKELSASLVKLEKLEKHFKHVKKFIKADKDNEMEEELEDMITDTEKARVDKETSAKRFDSIPSNNVIKSTEPTKVKFGQGRYIAQHQSHKRSKHNPKIIFIPHHRRYRKRRLKRVHHKITAVAAKDEQSEKKLPEAVVPLKSDETVHKENEPFLNQEEEKPKVEYVEPIKTNPNMEDSVSEKDEALAFGDLPMSDPSGTPKENVDKSMHENQPAKIEKNTEIEPTKNNQNSTEEKISVGPTGNNNNVNITESNLPVSKPKDGENNVTNTAGKENNSKELNSNKTSSNDSKAASSDNNIVHSDSNLHNLPLYNKNKGHKKKRRKHRKKLKNDKVKKINSIPKESMNIQNSINKALGPNAVMAEAELYVKHKAEALQKGKLSVKVIEHKKMNKKIENKQGHEHPEIKPVKEGVKEEQVSEKVENKQNSEKVENEQNNEKVENKPVDDVEAENKQVGVENKPTSAVVENKQPNEEKVEQQSKAKEDTIDKEEEEEPTKQSVENKEEKIGSVEKPFPSNENVENQEEEIKPMEKEKSNAEKEINTPSIDAPDDPDEDSPDVKVKVEPFKTDEDETPNSEESEKDIPIKTEWQEQEPMEEEEESAFVEGSDGAPLPPPPPPPLQKENIEVIDSEENYPIPNVYSEVDSDSAISEPLDEESPKTILKQNSEDSSREKESSHSGESELQQDNGRESAAIVVESGAAPDEENEDIDDYFKSEYDSSSSGSSHLDITEANKSENKALKLLADKESKKLQKPKADGVDSETSSDESDVDLDSYEEPKEEKKKVSSQSKTEDETTSSGSSPLTNADASSPPAANGTSERFDESGAPEENPDELSLTNITKEISSQLSDEVGDLQSKPIFEKSRANEDSSTKDDFESMQSLLLQHQSDKLKDADNANNELVEGIKQHNSVHLDLTHKHGESVQEFGHDRRETLADVDKIDDPTVFDEIGEKTHTEHQHSEHQAIDEEGTTATDVDDNWDQRICCTKHNKLCCPTPAPVVDEDGNEVVKKKVASLDSGEGKYSSGSEVVKDIKNDERVETEEIPHGDKSKLANDNTDMIDENEASDESTHKNTIETGRDHALTKNAILVFEAKNRAMNDSLSISSKTSEQDIQSEDSSSLTKDKVDSSVAAESSDVDSDVVLDPDMQAKLSKELESHSDGKDKMLSIKYHTKGRHKKHHRKHHIGSESIDRLATDEIGMLGEEVTNHENPSLEHEKTPVIFHHHDKDKDMDEAEKLLATERKLKEAKELERIKDEANKLLAAHKKVLRQKQRDEAIKALAETKVKQEKRKHMHKKKKQTVHRTPSKGKKISDEEAIPFLNEDPYPLTDFVSEYDKTAETKLSDDDNTNNNDKISKKEEMDVTNVTEKTDENVNVQAPVEQKSQTSSHASDNIEDVSEFPKRLTVKFQNVQNDIKNTTKSNLDDKSDEKTDDVLKKHTTVDTTEQKQDDTANTVGDGYSKLNNQEANLVDTDIQRHLPMLDEKDIVNESTAEMMNDAQPQRETTPVQTTSNFIDNDEKPKPDKNRGDMKNQIQNMLDKAFGEVLSV